MYYDPMAAQMANELVGEADRYRDIKNKQETNSDDWWRFHRLEQSKLNQAELIVKRSMGMI